MAGGISLTAYCAASISRVFHARRGLESSSTNAVGTFTRRAFLYARVDEDLSQHTRFFGAAALTNLMLARLFSRQGGWLAMSSTTGQFLQRLGSYLEDFNLEHARRIEGAKARIDGLDTAMVRDEQVEVQHQLNRLKVSNAITHKGALADLDRLLNLNSLAWIASCSSSCANVAIYRAALAKVRAQFGRSIDFEDLDHRECIGISLIGELRCSTVTM
jgi:hypothetical protein